MRKSWLIIGGIAVVIGGAILFLLLSRAGAPPKMIQAGDLPAQSAAPEAQPAQATQPGVYIPYSPEAVDKATGRRILFFHAPWCPQCRALEKSIQEGAIPNDVTIFKTDYDSRADLRQKYGITLQTTLVEINVNLEATGIYVAYSNPTLQAVVKGLGL